MYRHRVDPSWVDLLSNKAFVRNMRPDTLINIFLNQQFPEEIFFSYIHEATHHWTFTMPLVNTLFLLQFEAYNESREVLLKYFDPSKEPAPWNLETLKQRHKQVLDDELRWKFVQDILKPIAEGLAQFAEYDIKATKTEAVPDFLVYTMMMFSGIKREDLNERTPLDYEHPFNLFRARKVITTEDGILRKANLLVTSSALEDTPYLTGYLLIKTFQFILRSRNSKFDDPIVFFYFITHWFYYDFELIGKVLDRKLSTPACCREVNDHLCSRLNALKQLDAGHINTFETSMSANPRYYPAHVIAQTEKTRRDASTALHNRLNQLLASNQSIMAIFYMRSFFRLTQLPCYVEIDAKAELWIRFPELAAESEVIQSFLQNGKAKKRGEYIDVNLISIPNPEADPFQGAVLFEKYLWNEYIGHQRIVKEFIVLLNGDTPVFYLFTGSWKDEEKNIVKTYFGNRLSTVHSSTLLQTTIDFLSMFDTSQQTREVECIKADIYDAFERFSLHRDLDLRLTNQQILRKTGFGKILRSDIESIKLLSTISLLASNGSRKRSDHDFDTAAMQKLKDMLEEFNFAIFDFDENEYWSCCI
jgi:hypothetical protein